ncbi:protein GRAVITROPIC IN THE LIGHT 1 [Typha angustifolia]|uniref:protein GRAVITROPIC IN THE LIGHT 1 n=1 Tax=Typha angustifolia TaxID=59011 RepID=UPI003C2BE1BA
MLQKFALAFKTKTIEFFAEEEEDEDDLETFRAVRDLDPNPEAVITDQRVVVLKPDPNQPVIPNPKSTELDPQTLVSTLFATLSSFHAAYLHLQTAHSPFLPDAIRSADAVAVAHLRRLSDLKRFYSHFQNPNPNSAPDPPLSSYLEAQVRENQSLLRTFDSVINRLQADIDKKDAEAAELRERLREAEEGNAKLAARLDIACVPPPSSDENVVETLLSVGVFDSVLRDVCRITHRFAKGLVELMKRGGWDLGLAAESIYPGVNYAKPGHCRYAILSSICLGMFGGFNSYGFGIEGDEIDARERRYVSLRQFIEHSAADPFELINSQPSCKFAKFCKQKYQQLIHPGLESSLFCNSERGESLWGSLRPSSPLYESFIAMASSIWTLHRLAWAYDPVVEIFQVGQGTGFSIVFMEDIIHKASPLSSESGQAARPKVGFTVVPGFRVGRTTIQCRVYLDFKQAV